MNFDQAYDRWKEGRCGGQVPPGFTNHVMQAVHAAAARRSWLARLLIALAASRAGRAGLLTLALVVFAARLAAVVSVFVVNLAHPLE